MLCDDKNSSNSSGEQQENASEGSVWDRPSPEPTRVERGATGAGEDFRAKTKE